ncbi:MAG: ATP-binding protein [Candidatus Omnitrophota bacterium]
MKDFLFKKVDLKDRDMFIEPVFGKKFFGREEILSSLHKRVTALKSGYRQNMALTGPMLAGKSSILRHFLKNISDSEIIPLYIELDDVDFRLFCIQFMGSLLYYYLKCDMQGSYSLLSQFQKQVQTGVKNATSDGFESLKEMSRSIIPETVKCMDNVCEFLGCRKNNAAYETMLELTEIFKNETGKKCIVILDEFHNLSNFKLKKPFQVFGKFIMVQKNTMYVVSSSQKSLLKDILSEKLSLLFGNFEVIEVNGFDSCTSRAFISDKMKRFESLKEVENYFIQISQGNPFYLEVFVNTFCEFMQEKVENADMKECLLEVFARTLYDSNGVLNQYFTNNLNFFLEKKIRRKFIPILMSLARGNSTMKSIQKDLKKTDNNLGMKLQRLQEMDLVFNSGVFYKIADKLFEYWIKYVYCLKSQSMIDDLDIKYLEFKRFMENDFSEYCVFNRQSIKDIICGLFKAFDNSKIYINMNYRKMPRFDSLESAHINDNVICIRGKFSNKEWVCHVKENDIADENDVHRLCGSNSKNENVKVARKILIPLGDIEQNAFLVAKEQNIWVWSIEKLNKNLRLFGKFELVL